MEQDQEKQENTKNGQEQSGNNTQSNLLPIEQLICPECGSSRIRKRRILISFPVVIALFLVYPFLLEFVALLQFAKSGLAIVFVLMFLFCMLFIATWLWIVEIRRCKSCGHRFRMLHKTENKDNQIPFPWLFAVLNIIIIFIICISTREMIQHFLNASVSFLISYICIESIFAFIATGILSGISLLYQTALYYFLKKKLKNIFVWAILFLIPAVALGTNSLFHTLPRVKAMRILSYGRLASLPESAHDIKEYSWSFLFSGEWFLRFSASSEDIETFINNSKSIRGQDYEIYSSERMKLPYPQDIEKSIEYQEAGHVTYFPDPSAPDWYIQNIDNKAREYKIPADGAHNWGEVIVDDVNDVVYIKVVWS